MPAQGNAAIWPDVVGHPKVGIWLFATAVNKAGVGPEFQNTLGRGQPADGWLHEPVGERRLMTFAWHIAGAPIGLLHGQSTFSCQKQGVSEVPRLVRSFAQRHHCAPPQCEHDMQRNDGNREPALGA